jgi:hypothetical protein
MSAYDRGSLSIEAYLVRVIAALCRQAGGELRVKGELVDTVGEATALLKWWDSTKQELVLTTTQGSFGEVFRVVPERQPSKEQLIDLSKRVEHADRAVDAIRANGEEKTRTGSTYDDPAKLARLEQTLLKRRIAAMMRDEISRNRTASEKG